MRHPMPLPQRSAFAKWLGAAVLVSTVMAGASTPPRKRPVGEPAQAPMMDASLPAPGQSVTVYAVDH